MPARREEELQAPSRVSLDRRSACARGRRGAVPPPRPQPRPPLQRRQRAARGPRAGRLPRARARRRRIRPRARDRVHVLRGAEHRRGDQAPLPRQRLVGARAARPAGARLARRADQRRAAGRDRPRPDRRRDRRARRRGIEVEDVLEAREAFRALHSDSLDRPGGARDDDETASLLDTLGDADVEIGRAHDRAALAAVLDTLDERDRTIIQLYYQDELTQAEIGRRLGYSQMHVSRLLRQAVERLRLAAGQQEEPVAELGPPARPRAPARWCSPRL